MKRNRILAGILAVILIFVQTAPALAGEESGVAETLAAKLQITVPSPAPGAVGGEWLVLGLVRGEYPGASAAAGVYLQNLKNKLQECGGVLHSRKYTEYARTVLAVTALGLDARSVAGYNLLAPLADEKQTLLQGVNGAAYALLALDCGEYPMPKADSGKQQASREGYLAYLLSQQKEGGGWALSGAVADPDITAMVLQALAPYAEQPTVEQATRSGLAALARMQQEDGGFFSMGAFTCESCAQVLLALDALDLTPAEAGLVKNGHTPEDAMLSFWDGAMFRHVAGGSGDGMASEQALCALAAMKMQQTGAWSFFRMGKPARFPDIGGHPYRAAIEALAESGAINGMGDGTFSPDLTMDRAQFCAVTVRALELAPLEQDFFSDVKNPSWYRGYVGAAFRAGIVEGVGGGKFAPNATITRQEAAVMLCRAAKILGLETRPSSQTPLPEQAASWAKEAVGWCIEQGIWCFEPDAECTAPILRGEIAQMIHLLLQCAKKENV